MISEEQQEKLQTLIALFELAESKIKEIERLDYKLLIPSINELRYAGYHVLKALINSNNEFDSEFEKATNHCKRAIYDAYEVGIVYCLEEIRDFKQCFNDCSDLIPEVIQTYFDDLLEAEKARSFLNENKSGNRYEYYEDGKPYYQKLNHIGQKFDLAKPTIQDKYNKKFESDIKQARRFIITVILSLIGLLVSASIFCIAYINLQQNILVK